MRATSTSFLIIRDRHPPAGRTTAISRERFRSDPEVDALLDAIDDGARPGSL
jgi:hypothetical protein